MAAMACSSGTKVLIATPHSYGNECFGGEFSMAVTAAAEYLKNETEMLGIPLEILTGMEIYGTPETSEMLECGDLLTLNGTKYALIEFGFEETARNIYDILISVEKAGYIPVVAHPERYTCICRDIEVAKELVSHGCLLQINKGSLTGFFGTDIMRTAILLMKKELAFCIASDAHSPKRRTTDMSEAIHTVRELFSDETAEKLFYSNPLKIIKSEPFDKGASRTAKKEYR